MTFPSKGLQQYMEMLSEAEREVEDIKELISVTEISEALRFIFPLTYKLSICDENDFIYSVV